MELKLTPEQVNVVLAGLQELPHKYADPVIREIMQQVQAQNDDKKEGDE